MYDYRCKNCENLGHCMPMMNMPMNMSMMNMPMNMPMINMPMYEDKDGDLKMLYPKIYLWIFPMVKHHHNKIVSMHGTMYCPSKDEMDHICKEVCDKYDECYRDDDDYEDCNDDEMRQRRHRSRRRGIGDLFRILLIRELLGGRQYGGYWG